MTDERRVVVVTGTSRGIGTGIVTRLLATGARVVGVSRTGRTPVASDSLLDVRCDLRDARMCSVVLDATLEAFGRVDGLVNNAGVQFYANCWEQTDDELEEMLAVNLTAPFRLSRAFAQHWVDRGQGGSIVHVCSVESKVAWPRPGQAGYAVTKGGLLGLTRAMAYDLATHGIRVNAVGPGVIETEMSPADLGELSTRIPLGGRLGSPEEVGDAVAFLLSDAATYVTGEILYVDGGYVLA